MVESREGLLAAHRVEKFRMKGEHEGERSRSAFKKQHGLGESHVSSGQLLLVSTPFWVPRHWPSFCVTNGLIEVDSRRAPELDW